MINHNYPATDPLGEIHLMKEKIYEIRLTESNRDDCSHVLSYNYQTFARDRIAGRMAF